MKLLLVFLVAILAVLLGALLGARYGFREGYLRGLKSEANIDDLLKLLDRAHQEAQEREPPPPMHTDVLPDVRQTSQEVIH